MAPGIGSTSKTRSLLPVLRGAAQQSEVCAIDGMAWEGSRSGGNIWSCITYAMSCFDSFRTVFGRFRGDCGYPVFVVVLLSWAGSAQARSLVYFFPLWGGRYRLEDWQSLKTTKMCNVHRSSWADHTLCPAYLGA